MLDSVEAQPLNIKKVALSEIPKTAEAPFLLERDVPETVWKQIKDRVAHEYKLFETKRAERSEDTPQSMRRLLMHLSSLHMADPHQAHLFPLGSMWDSVQSTIEATPMLGTFTTFSNHADLLVNILNLLPDKRGELPCNDKLLEEFQYNLKSMGQLHGLYGWVLINFMQLYPEQAAQIDKTKLIQLLEGSIEAYLEKNDMNNGVAALSSLKILDSEAADKYLTRPVWDLLKQHIQNAKSDWDSNLRFIERLSILSADRVEVGANGMRLIKKDKPADSKQTIPVVKAA